MKKLILTSLSVLFLLVEFLPMDWVYCVYIGLVPFIILNETSNPKKAFIYSTIVGSVFYGVRFYWMMDVLYTFNGLKFAYVYLLVILLSATFFGVFGFLISKMSNKKYKAFYIALGLVIIEFVRGNFPIIAFTWGRLSDVLYSQTNILKLASIGGEWLLLYIIVLINYLILFLLKKKWFGYIMIILIIIGIYGVNQINMRNPNKIDGKVKIAIVQPNIDPWIKYYKDTSGEIYNLIKESIKNGANYVILPEASLIYNNPKNDYEIKRYSKNATIIIGSAYYQNNKFYNSDFVVRNSKFKEYKKHHLVPYVEYVPFRNIFGKVAGVPSSDTVAGTGIQIFGKKAKFGIEICFESIFPYIARNYAINGVNFIVVSTNDGWFKNTFAVEEHFRKLNIIAAETGVNFIQSANTGISGFVDYTGKTIIKSKKNIRTILYVKHNLHSAKTIYDLLGNWWIIILCIPIILLEMINRESKYKS